MPQTLFHNDFSAGWCPNDDPMNGRKNSLLKMDNVELDRNGILRLSGGASKFTPAYDDYCHSLFITTMNGSRVDYAGDILGTVYRNRSSLSGGGSATKAAFGEAYKYTLICSGNYRVKDTGSGTPKNLGIVPPGATIVTPTIKSFYTPKVAILDWKYVGGAAYSEAIANIVTFTANTATITLESTTTQSAVDYTAMYDLDTSALAGIGASVDDITNVQISPTAGSVNNIVSLVFTYLLEQPAGDGAVTNLFQYTYERGNADPSIAAVSPNMLNLEIPRSAFTQLGPSTTLNWTNVRGIRIRCETDANCTFYTVINFPGGFIGGNVPLRRDTSYSWVQVNVFKDGSYTGKSIPGTAYDLVDTNHAPTYLKYTPYVTGISPDVTEIWIFRRGGGLKEYYRVAVIGISATAYKDLVLDDDALIQGIKLNTNLIAVNSASMADPILEIIGPMEGRWFYFTNDFLYASDINNPDAIDVSKSIRITATNNEKFRWARKLSDNTITVGTSKDVYIISGTFQTFPDFTVDIYRRAVGCSFPPIISSAAVYNNQVFSLSSGGWRVWDANGNDQSLVGIDTSRIYNGETIEGYLSLTPGVLTPTFSNNYCVSVANNKLYCCIGSTGRIEVYDLIRKYWRNCYYKLGSTTLVPSILAQIPGGGISGVFTSTQRDFDLRSTSVLDGTDLQPVSIKTQVFDAGMARNRKDSLTFKLHCKTGTSEPITVSLITDGSVSNSLGTITQPTVDATVIVDIRTLPVSKTYQLALTGNFSILEIMNFSVDFEARPPQLTSYIIRATNLGNSSPKRVRNWPFHIDTLGNTITVTPNIDGTNTATSTFSSSTPRTLFHQFLTDVFGTDYEMRLSGGPFELYDGNYAGGVAGSPEIVQILPAPVRFDQVGPFDLARYGKVLGFDIRVLATGTSLPYIIYLDDDELMEGTITTIANKEKSYTLSTKQGVSGSLLRIVLGPAASIFYRYYIRVKVSRSGNDTQNEWITIGEKA